MTRRFLNGGTRYVEDITSRLYVGKQTWRTETSKYPEEEKTIVISGVAASETEIAQTGVVSAASGL